MEDAHEHLARARRERDQLQVQIDKLPDGIVKTHMLGALAALDAELSSVAPSASNDEDALVFRMKNHAVMVKQPQDALVAMVHFMMQESGFVHTANTGNDTSLFLPPHWDKNSDQGIFVFEYTHPNSAATKYTLKALYVGRRTLAIHIAANDDVVHSLELDASMYVRDTTSSLAGDAVQQSGQLRRLWSTFSSAFRPSAPSGDAGTHVPSGPHPGSLRLDRPAPAPPLYPNVGGGDAFPEFLGPPPHPNLGRRDPGMQVGPDHPLFSGRLGGSPFGPVPGARFDPYGPVGPSNLFRPQPGREPRGPPLFGGPDNDHLPMPGFPRHDDMFS
ncbi:hypothetical protein H310_09623 [Aphanomyces invadans]|uniref:PI31 proteasome regulator N-terminal domain-containing protein n=1 Tax=Aphanomyces invadans TaxID=157072 RepID=A0A024TSY0_9STRA|nr:hypothetical protein H310_09623 [Aphanomyces invadans]ETV97260.1 hypothetical protein H310_09623 [Aphanomyces invadans]|eukprot:XP_008873968.1 hypothetical protein H310_09623 [Aphanomyces invadans]